MICNDIYTLRAKAHGDQPLSSATRPRTPGHESTDQRARAHHHLTGPNLGEHRTLNEIDVHFSFRVRFATSAPTGFWHHNCRAGSTKSIAARSTEHTVDTRPSALAELSRLPTIGEAYVSGQVSLATACAMLDLSPWDLIPIFENCGYVRSLAMLTLSDDERTAIYTKMRLDRLARQGSPVLDRRLVLRDVIASQRIEGIDARPWAQTQLK